MEFSRQKRSPSLTFAGKYDSELSNEAVLKAVGELSFDYTNIFSSHDLATFEVIKLKSDKPPQEGESPPKESDKEGNKSPKPDYDIQINITPLNHAVNPPVSVTVVFKGWGNLREGKGKGRGLEKLVEDNE